MLLGVNDHPFWSTDDPNGWFAPWLDKLNERHLDMLRLDAQYDSLPSDAYMRLVFDLLASRSVIPFVTVMGGARPTAAPDPFVYAAACQRIALQMTNGGFIEIWNEPNLAPDFWPTPANPTAYAHLVFTSYWAVRAVAPNVKTILGSLLFNDQTFLQSTLDATPIPPFDGISVHPYAENFLGPPDRQTNPWYSVTTVLEDTRATLVARGFHDTPIYVSEYGLLDLTVPTDDEQAASYYRAAREIAEQHGVAAFMAFHGGSRQTADNAQSSALLRTDLSETLAWQAFMSPHG